MSNRYFIVSIGSFFIILGCMESSPGAVFFLLFVDIFSSLPVNGLLYFFNVSLGHFLCGDL